jgi:chorismate-pyruvate lyase
LNGIDRQPAGHMRRDVPAMKSFRDPREPAMRPIAISCPRNVELLSVFLDREDEQHCLQLEMVDPAQVPQPLHQLLVHQRDMTSTLTEFHGEPIRLDVLEQRVVGSEVWRHVILRGEQSGRPLEYGASRIRLDALAQPARQVVLAGREPLGGILNALGMRYRSCPGGFLRVRPHPLIASALQLHGRSRNQWLFGRCNCLDSSQAGVLAEVVEILPPS